MEVITFKNYEPLNEYESSQHVVEVEVHNCEQQQIHMECEEEFKGGDESENVHWKVQTQVEETNEDVTSQGAIELEDHNSYQSLVGKDIKAEILQDELGEDQTGVVHYDFIFGYLDPIMQPLDVEDDVCKQSLMDEDTMANFNSEELVAENYGISHEIMHYDFVFGDMDLVEKPLVVGFNMKHRSNFHMEMISFLQVKGGWSEKYLVNGIASAQRNVETTYMVTTLFTNNFVPCASRLDKDTLRSHWRYITMSHGCCAGLSSKGSLVFCFLHQPLDSRTNPFQGRGDEVTLISYKVIYWLIGFMLECMVRFGVRGGLWAGFRACLECGQQ